jgi:hypothetical protein
MGGWLGEFNAARPPGKAAPRKICLRPWPRPLIIRLRGRIQRLDGIQY